jgi:hypothetical protein
VYVPIFFSHYFSWSKIIFLFALVILVIAYPEVHVQVRMVTGDNIQTAKAIAAECGILTPHGVAIEGKDFRVMTPQEQYDLLPNVDVRLRFFYDCVFLFSAASQPLVL